VGSKPLEATYDVSTTVRADFPSIPILLPPCFGGHRRVSLSTRLNASELSTWIWIRGPVHASIGRIFMFDNYIIEVRPPSAGVTFRAGMVVRDGCSFTFFAASHVF
jgi:hypothetical protein